MEANEVLRIWKVRRRRQMLLSALAMLSLVGLWVMRVLTRRGDLSLDAAGPLRGAMFIVFVIAIALTWRNFRCPSCNKYVLSPMGAARVCFRCGAALR